MTTTMCAIQQAVYSMLNQDSGLMGHVQAIYDHAPVNPQWPCIILGSTNARDWSTKHCRGAQVVMDLHVVSDQAGRKQTLDIMDMPSTLLREHLLSVTNLQLVAKQVEQAVLPPVEAEEMMQGTVRFRAFFEEA
jgi:hypothetical protein